MSSRLVALLLLALLVAIHAQLWTGRASLGQVQQMRAQLAEREAANTRARLINEQLASQVEDLKNGLDLVEEKARSELGMVRRGEIFVRVAPAAASSRP